MPATDPEAGDLDRSNYGHILGSNVEMSVGINTPAPEAGGVRKHPDVLRTTAVFVDGSPRLESTEGGFVERGGFEPPTPRISL